MKKLITSIHGPCKDLELRERKISLYTDDDLIFWSLLGFQRSIKKMSSLCIKVIFYIVLESFLASFYIKENRVNRLPY